MTVNTKPLRWLNFAFLFEMQSYLLPVTIFFYIENGLTVEDYIFFQALSAIFYIVFGVPAGYIADHFSKKYILILGFLFNIARLLLWISFGGYWIVFTGEMFAVVVRLFTTGMSDSYLYEYLREKNNTKKTLGKYGEVSSFMSWGMAIAALLSPFFYKWFGLYFLLYLELALTSVGMLFLCLLPKTNVYNKQKYSIIEIKNAFLNLLKNDYLKRLIGLNIILYVTTAMFVSTFQPLMKISAVPVVLFGVIYFINHSLRGVFSRLAKKVFMLMPLGNLLSCTSLVVLASFILLIIAFKIENIQFTVITLVFVCVCIGLQLANQIITITEIHKYVSASIRATSISVFNMLCRGIGGVLLIGFKDISAEKGFSVGYLCFAIAFLIIVLFILGKYRVFYNNMAERKAIE